MIKLTPRLEKFGFTTDILERLERRHDESRYWQRSYTFVLQVSQNNHQLSLNQHNWLVEIVASLELPWG